MEKNTKCVSVYEYLRIFIDQSKFSENNKLPSEEFLCRKFNVCRQTVRRAIKRLSDEGLVYSVRGSGTFFNIAEALANKTAVSHNQKRIALIVQGQDRGANKQLVQGIKEKIADSNAELRIFFTDNKVSNERKCLEFCKTGFDGLIIDGVKATIINPNLDVYASLYARKIPFIFYNNYYSGTGYPKIITDDISSADVLVDQLVKHGHRTIAGIFFFDNYQGTQKYLGYMQACIKYGAVYDDRYVRFFLSDDTTDNAAFEKLLWSYIKTVPKCSAFICGNMMIYKALRKAMTEHGREMGKDYSIVCFDYSSEDYEIENITCTKTQGYSIGKMIGENILKMMEDADYRKHDYSYKFPPELFLGDSIIDLNRK